jgi:putative transcriptional regulator
MAIVIRVDVMLARRQMKVAELADAIGITPANLSILKNGHAKAVRFSTLEALCRELQCTPGELIEYVPDDAVR